MRTLISVLILIVGVWAWTALPATAGDDDKAEDEARVAALEAEVVRYKAEALHLREAFNTLRENAMSSTRALTALTGSLNASRGMLDALATQADELRQELQQLRADITKRPGDDPARLKLALHDERRAHATDVTQLQESLNKCTERANRHAISLVGAQNERAKVLQEHEGEVAALNVKLAAAMATIKALRAAK